MSVEQRDRAEDLALRAESLERQMQTQGASIAALLAVSNVIDAARELYNELAGGR